MAEPPGALTRSSSAAVRWAFAAAAVRDGASPEPPPPTGADLLVGLALAHPRDNPVQDLFAYFELPLGAVLDGTGLGAVGPDALLAAVERVPEDAGVPTSGEVEDVVRYARTELPPDGDGLVTVGALFVALLETLNPTGAVVRRLLGERREDADAVVRTCREHLGAREPLATVLGRRHPRRPIELPPYAADTPPDGHRAPGSGAVAADLVGVGAEADAFAYLIASRRLHPPLAVGLFGDWGAGKSWFMRSLRRRIDAISGLGLDSFHRSIAHVEFNAWQYVEGDLWASLLEHLFRNLRTAPDDSDELLAWRTQYWIGEIDKADAERAQARAERSAVEGERASATAEVGRRITERDAVVADLERAQRERPFAGSRASDALVALRDEALRRAGLAGVASELGGVTNELDRSAATLREAGALLAPIRARGWRFVSAVVVVVMLTPVVALVLDRFDLSGVVAAAGSLSWLLAAGAGYLKIGNDVLRSGLDKVAEAQRLLTAETENTRGELDARIEEARHELDTATAALKEAVARERALDRRAAELAAALAEVTPAGVLNEFIAERTGSDDYRRHLGIPAVVRRDLERLTRLVAQQRVDDEQHAIDRVVLYIDDLDRCPSDQVIKVLEAVHLLLAFPLFVVVVAVDSRWLESSLREHYPQLREVGAAPEDYLEKIFQVPYRVRSLDPVRRRAVLRGLLAPSVRSRALANDLGPSAATPLGSPGEREHFERVVASLGESTVPDRPAPDAADLTITNTESERIEGLASLLGSTPRALKRFVNVYLLVKSMGLGRGWVPPEQGQVALLLAVATAAPGIAAALHPLLASGTPVRLPAMLPTEAGDRRSGEQRAHLAAWFAENPSWAGVDVTGLGPWLETILRFGFTSTEPDPR